MSAAKLNSRIKRLTSQLPKESATVLKHGFNESQRDKISSIILLASAEFEYFLEQCVLKRIESSYNLWRKKRQPTQTMLAIFHAGHPARRKTVIGGVNEEFNKPYSQAIEQAYRNVRKLVDDNNGINEDDTKALLTCIGVDVASLNIEITILSNFTRSRGAIAHLPDGKHKVIMTQSTNVVKSELVQSLKALECIARTVRSV